MKRLLAGLLVACLGLPAIASAGPGYTVDDVTLRAGPSTDYPRITVLPAGISIEIYGCLDDWSWCDVSTGLDRGWVSGYYVESVYDNRRVIIADYGPRIGLPVLSFVLGAYWVDHYRNRPWYRNRSSWEHRHISHGRPARPSWYRHDRPDYRPTRPNRPPNNRRAPGNPPIPVDRSRNDRDHSNRNPRTTPGNPPIPVTRSPSDRRGSDQNRGRGAPAHQATPRGNPPVPVQRAHPGQNHAAPPQPRQNRQPAKPPAAAGRNNGSRAGDQGHGKDASKDKDKDRH